MTSNDTYNYADDFRYEHWVRVQWPDDEIVDAIKADTPAEVEEAAQINWPGAIITLLPQLSTVRS